MTGKRKKIGERQTIDGKTYTLYVSTEGKARAKQHRETLKRQGYSVRVRPTSDNHYLIYRRK